MNAIRTFMDDIKDDVNQENSAIVYLFDKILSYMFLILIAGGLPYLAYLYIVSGL
jgi:hypothetical protein